MDWLEQLILTHLERDIPPMGFRVPVNRLRRLWTMLAHLQSETVNYSQLAGFLQELFDCLGKNLTLIGAVYSRHFENKSIVQRKTTNEYFQYLFEPWNCSRTKFTRNGQNHLPYMCATDPKRHYSTRSFMSTGLSFRLSWPAMARLCQHTSQKNLTRI